MKIISHRGNLTGSNPVMENSIPYIEQAISEGFDAEIDLRVENNECYLGHDDPQYFVTLEWLEKYKDSLWIHCKNREALEKMSNSFIEFNFFYHDSDSYTLTSKGIGWILVGQLPYKKAVIVLPENVQLYSYRPEYIEDSYGICTDIPIFYKEKFGVKK